MSPRAKKEKIPSLNVNSRLKNVKILLSTQRVKEAIAYLYLIYTDLVAKIFGVSMILSDCLGVLGFFLVLGFVLVVSKAHVW